MKCLVTYKRAKGDIRNADCWSPKSTSLVVCRKIPPLGPLTRLSFSEKPISRYTRSIKGNQNGTQNEGGARIKSLGGRTQQAPFFLSAASRAEQLFCQGLLGTPKMSVQIYGNGLYSNGARPRRRKLILQLFLGSCGYYKGPWESPKSLLNEVDVENIVHPHRVYKPHRFRVGGNAARSLAHSSRESRKKTSGMPHNSGNTKEEDGGTVAPSVQR